MQECCNPLSVLSRRGVNNAARRKQLLLESKCNYIHLLSIHTQKRCRCCGFLRVAFRIVAYSAVQQLFDEFETDDMTGEKNQLLVRTLAHFIFCCCGISSAPLPYRLSHHAHRSHFLRARRRARF